MSWFADLAGKAELLLEKVDKTAANALQVEKGIGSESSSSVNPQPRGTTTSAVEKSYGGTADDILTGKGASKTSVNINDGKF